MEVLGSLGYCTEIDFYASGALFMNACKLNSKWKHVNLKWLGEVRGDEGGWGPTTCAPLSMWITQAETRKQISWPVHLHREHSKALHSKCMYVCMYVCTYAQVQFPWWTFILIMHIHIVCITLTHTLTRMHMLSLCKCVGSFGFWQSQLEGRAEKPT